MFLLNIFYGISPSQNRSSKTFVLSNLRSCSNLQHWFQLMLSISILNPKYCFTSLIMKKDPQIRRMELFSAKSLFSERRKSKVFGILLPCSSIEEESEFVSLFVRICSETSKTTSCNFLEPMSEMSLWATSDFCNLICGLETT